MLICRILGLTDVHKRTMPLHIACMYHLKHLNSKLFLLAHELVDREPENAISWYSVGIWYMCIGKYQEARTYFRYAPTPYVLALFPYIAFPVY